MIEEQYIQEVQRLRSQMVSIATHYLQNRDDAEDAVQNTLLRLWTVHPMIVPQSVDRIAFTVLKRICINELTRRSMRRRHEVDTIDNLDIPATSEYSHEADEREQKLIRIVSKLPSRQQMMLRMRYIKGKDIATIARISGTTEDSVYMVLSRARTNIMKMMAVVVATVIIVLCPILFNHFGKQEELAIVNIANSNTTQSPTLNTTNSRNHSSKPKIINKENDAATPTLTTPQIKHIDEPTPSSTKENQLLLVKTTDTKDTDSESKAMPPTRTEHPQTQQNIIEKSVLIYSDSEGFDAHLEAKLAYVKNDKGYKLISCDYIPVSDSGLIITFHPEEYIPNGTQLTDMRLKINGTLKFTDSDGGQRERYVSINRLLASNI